jgi:hypothetical protein
MPNDTNRSNKQNNPGSGGGSMKRPGDQHSGTGDKNRSDRDTDSSYDESDGRSSGSRSDE